MKSGALEALGGGLKRADELDGKHLRLVGQILCPHPVVGANRFMRLREESLNFIDEVFLRGFQLFAGGHLQISFRDANVVGGAARGLGLLPRRKLRSDLRRRFRFGLGRLGWGGGARRRRQRVRGKCPPEAAA